MTPSQDDPTYRPGPEWSEFILHVRRAPLAWIAPLPSSKLAEDHAALPLFPMQLRVHGLLESALSDLNQWLLTLLCSSLEPRPVFESLRASEPMNWAPVLHRAITNASLVSWMLGPEEGTDRIGRLLLAEFDETLQLRRAMRFSRQSERSADTRDRLLSRLAREHRVRLRGGVRMREVLDEVAPSSRLDGPSLRTLHALLDVLGKGSNDALSLIGSLKPSETLPHLATGESKMAYDAEMRQRGLSLTLTTTAGILGRALDDYDEATAPRASRLDSAS